MRRAGLGDQLAEVRDEVKRTVTMKDVLRLCGLPEPGRNNKIHSPFNPADRTPSCHIYDYDFYDYSTGIGGDQISFVQEYQGVSYKQALQILGQGTMAAVRPREDHSHDMPWEPADLTRKFEDEPEGDWDEHAAWEHYVEEKWPYLKMVDVYGFHNKITADNELWTPHWVPDDDGKPVVRGVKIRNLDGSKYSVKGSEFIVGLYRPRPWKADANHALIVEGESDAWVMAKMLDGRDVTVFGLPSGASAWKDRFERELDGFQTVTLAFDDDEAGREATATVQESLDRLVYVVTPPGGRIAEAAADGWRL